MIKLETKVKFFLSLEKEENWLNEQLKKRLELVQVIGGFIYRFQPLKAENQIVRMDYRTFSNSEQYKEYKIFMEDVGWHHAGGKKDTGRQYFVGNETGETELFSDDQSKVERTKRVRDNIVKTALIILPVHYLLLNDSSNLGIFTELDTLFLTPGLWQREGFSFWFSFLFELPFATIRLFAAIGFPILLIAFALTLLHLQYKITKSTETL